MEKLKNIPEGYHYVTPYLIIPNATAFFDFTAKVFGATKRHKTMREDGAALMHGEILIGDSVIMFADATDKYHAQPAGLYVYVEFCDTAYGIALENGAEVVMEPADQSYGRSCGVKDPFGNTWWITSVI